ncbi:MAG: alpha/beta hydrolase [Deinococcales bacterium]
MNKLGVLVCHGFTAQPKTVDYIVPFLEQAGLPYAIPTLRGHGTVWTDLRGVRWQDWLEDATSAYTQLEQTCERVAVVGHSMGGLVAAQLAAQKPVAALVLVAPAFRFANPLAPLVGMLQGIIKDWKGDGSAILDPELRAEAEAKKVTYQMFPTAAFGELSKMAKLTPSVLPGITAPTLILHSLKDTVIPPSAADLALERIGSSTKRIRWLQNCNHEVFWDAERDFICDEIVKFVLETGNA